MGTRMVMLLLAAAIAPPSFAQEAAKPYAGEEKREIKALSAAEIERYRAGHGMGFAMAAELNHYPGPKHVLELAKELGVTEGQITKIRSIHDRMHAATVRLGQRLIEGKRALDGLFAAGEIDEASLAKSVGEIARLEGEIRLAHLRAHLETRVLLTPGQVAKYDEMRGYGREMPAAHGPARHGH